MGMSICPTGYCGYPCYCKSSYDHLETKDCDELIEILDERKGTIALKDADLTYGEPMLAFKATVVSLKAIRYQGELYEVDHHLHNMIHRSTDDIYTLSGMVSANLIDDVWSFLPGCVDDAHVKFRYELVSYKGTVSCMCSAIDPAVDINGYLHTGTKTDVYLPKGIM